MQERPKSLTYPSNYGRYGPTEVPNDMISNDSQLEVSLPNYARYRHGYSLPEVSDDLSDGPSDRGDVTPVAVDRDERGVDLEAGSGALSTQEHYGDSHQYEYTSTFPSGVGSHSETGFTPAKTTFYAKEAPDHREARFDELWEIHNGVDGWAESPIDEIDHGHRFDLVRRDKYLGCDAILQTFGVPSQVKKRAIRRTLATDLRGFSGHYAGLFGAVIGFTLVALFNSKKDAVESGYWPDVEGLCASLEIDPDALAEYVFGLSPPQGGEC